MVSRKNLTSSSERFMPSCLPTAISSAGVGAFTLPMVPSLVTGDAGGLRARSERRPRDPSIVGTIIGPEPDSRHWDVRAGLPDVRCGTDPDRVFAVEIAPPHAILT